jgi:hypothetical protein
MSEQRVTYKIRRAGSNMFSCGAIYTNSTKQTGEVVVQWSKKGKEWTTEKLLKAHLTKCIEMTGGVPSNWEIFELTYNATPIEEWIDNKMLVKILSHNKEN